MPELGDAFLRTSWTQLRKRTRSRKETYYFVVDGLDNIPVEDVHVTKFVLDMLPIGLPGFRFLLSGQIDRLSKQVSEQVSLKTYTLSGFTIGQTVEYFKHCGVDQSSLSRIHRICRRMPGRLSQARRILLSGGTIQDLLEETEWFDVEWRRIDAEDDSQLSFLAVLSR